MVDEESRTEPLTREEFQRLNDEKGAKRKRFWFAIGDGEEKHVPRGDRSALGSHPSNDMVLEDRKVSRFHCEVASGDDGYRIRDLGSRNGTFVDGVRIEAGWVRDGSLIQIGNTSLRFRTSSDTYTVPVSKSQRFGELVGRSLAMREAFGILERAAKADVTVLIEGETGTGKELTAASIHQRSVRAEGPFVVVDCSSIPENLIESELFGHERGAFTGAVNAHAGAFEQADGGTIFLDELGELPSDLQPKLLRALESRSIRPVGGKKRTDVDVRVIAATNRNLRHEVNEGRFRHDLYYRVAVLRVVLPPLRSRHGDMPLLVETLLRGFGASEQQLEQFTSDRFLSRLASHPWPGNVRELRNYLERCLVLETEAPINTGLVEQTHATAADVDLSLPFAEARKRGIAAVERQYLRQLMEQHDSVAGAAKAAGLHRVYLHRLLTRHQIRRQKD